MTQATMDLPTNYDAESDEISKDVIIRLPKDVCDTKLGKTKLLTLLKQMGAEVIEETSRKKDVPVADDIREVFDHHAEVMAPHFPKGLDYSVEWRRDTVRARLRRFTVDQLKQAIDYTAQSTFHLGQNDANKKYLDIDHIMGNDKKVERKITDEKMTQIANEADEIRLTLTQIGAKLRAGSAGLADQEQFTRLVGKLRELTGETYYWKEDRFGQ